jgi:hypothetical protein
MKKRPDPAVAKNSADRRDAQSSKGIIPQQVPPELRKAYDNKQGVPPEGRNYVPKKNLPTKRYPL